MGTPNWGKLVINGMAKAIGISWTTEDEKALSDGVPADYVRNGCLTMEDYKKTLQEESEQGKQLENMSQKELLDEAKKEDVDASSEAGRNDLIAEVKKKRGRPKKDSPKK